MPKRAYIDTSVLIAAFQGKGALRARGAQARLDRQRCSSTGVAPEGALQQTRVRGGLLRSCVQQGR